MTVRELAEELFRRCADGVPHDCFNSCDTLKCGTPETEVRKTAVTMFATPEAIRAAAQRGAQLLIVHEPAFNDHFGNRLEEPVTPRSPALRFRDVLHAGHGSICNAADLPCSRLPLCFGTPGGVFGELCSDEVDAVPAGGGLRMESRGKCARRRAPRLPQGASDFRTHSVRARRHASSCRSHAGTFQTTGNPLFRVRRG